MNTIFILYFVHPYIVPEPIVITIFIIFEDV